MSHLIPATYAQQFKAGAMHDSGLICRPICIPINEIKKSCYSSLINDTAKIK